MAVIIVVMLVINSPCFTSSFGQSRFTVNAATLHDHSTGEWNAWSAKSGTVGDAGTVTNLYLDSDFSGLENNITIQGEVHLCLNGNTLDLGSHNIQFASGAALYIDDCGSDSSNPGTITSNANNMFHIVQNNVTFQLDNGRLQHNYKTDYTAAINVPNANTNINININGGSIISQSVGIRQINTNSGVDCTINVNGGTIDATYGAIQAKSSGSRVNIKNSPTLTSSIGQTLLLSSCSGEITGGSFKAEKKVCIDIDNGASFNIKGGTFESSGSHTLNVNNSKNSGTTKVNVTDGNFTTNLGGYTLNQSGSSEVNIFDGTFTNTEKDTIVINSGSLNISGGEFTSTKKVALKFNNETTSTGDVFIYGGTFFGKENAVRKGIAGTLHIKGGDFENATPGYTIVWGNNIPLSQVLTDKNGNHYAFFSDKDLTQIVAVKDPYEKISLQVEKVSHVYVGDAPGYHFVTVNDENGTTLFDTPVLSDSLYTTLSTISGKTVSYYTYSDADGSHTVTALASITVTTDVTLTAHFVDTYQVEISWTITNPTVTVISQPQYVWNPETCSYTLQENSATTLPSSGEGSISITVTNKSIKAINYSITETDMTGYSLTHSATSVNGVMVDTQPISGEVNGVAAKATFTDNFTVDAVPASAVGEVQIATYTVAISKRD